MASGLGANFFMEILGMLNNRKNTGKRCFIDRKTICYVVYSPGTLENSILPCLVAYILGDFRGGGEEEVSIT